MRKSKDYSEDKYKDTTKLKNGKETIDDMTKDELMAEDEDELVSEDEDGLMAENKDEFMTEDEGELLAEDEEEPRAEDDDGTRPEVPIWCTGSGTSTLRRHLSSHKIPAPKQRQRTMHDYHIDSHPEKEQDERDKLVANWIICVDCEKW
ncbi:unnamed protein product [Rhizophagus irregularis]|nr:unnamed protein product [Rhizophagus irregularis]